MAYLRDWHQNDAKRVIDILASDPELELQGLPITLAEARQWCADPNGYNGLRRCCCELYSGSVPATPPR
ncbi:MAG: hypothetical protein ACRDAX_07815 [Propionibacteriaceae bacterium]